jgi:hypothetical protein
MFGVSTFVAPYTPSRSARSVSMVTNRTLVATAGGVAGASPREHPDDINTKDTKDAEVSTFRVRCRIDGGLA